MEGIVVSVVTGAMKSLLPKLTTLLNKCKLSKGVKKEISSLIDEMSTMNALLVELSKMEELDEQQEEWRDKVRELSYDIEDCIDIFTNDLGSDNAGIWKKLKAQYKIADRIQELKARIDVASSCHNRYRHDGDKQLSDDLVTVDPRVEALHADTTSLVGTERARDKIIGWLMDGEHVQELSMPCFKPWNFTIFLQELYYFIRNFFKSPVTSIPSKKVKVIAIVGIGGAGKTAIANQVYTKVRRQFDCRALVSVPRKPNWVKIFSDVLSEFGCSVPPMGSVSVYRLRSLIREHLKDKRYLIVIDDLWSEKEWTVLKSSLAQNNLGSRVIITTRHEHVAQAWRPLFDGHVYKIEPLNDFDSRRLFDARIFGSKDACPEQLQGVSDEIVKKCGGLPLAIISVARTLASREMVNSLEIWQNFRFHLERNPGFELMRHVLNIGYNDLSLDLKTCMLYLGIFPEDSKIIKDDLVKRWVAEGFITEKDTCPEAIAESYFNELINRNMIQIADVDDCGHVFSCRVHDVMLDYIILKAREENFFTIIKDLQSTKGSFKVRRLSLQECSRHELGDMAHARSLNFWGPAQYMPSLSKFQLLRVIHLDVYDSKREQCDLSSIRKFFQLRYLRIGGIGCKKLRRHLCKLQHLKTLEILPVPDEEKNITLEIDVGALPQSLRHLVVPTTVKLFGRIDKMKDLHTLNGLDIDLTGVDRNVKGIGELTKLRELTLSLSHDVSKHANSVGNFLLSAICKLSSLQSLTIRGELVDIDALTRWHPTPRHLRRLHVMACPFSTVPADWITQLRNLKSLELKVVSLTRSGAEVLERLTMLVHLRLHVEEHAPEEGVIIHSAEFPQLKEFFFTYRVPCLVFKADAMPKLRTLTIQCYANAERQADGVLDGIEHLGSLNACKVEIADFEIELQAGKAEDARQREVLRWDKQILEAAFRKAINKHPGSLDITIQKVNYGPRFGPSHDYKFRC